MKKHLLSILLIAALGNYTSQAALVLVDDFSSGVSGWTTSGSNGAFNAVADPVNAANGVAELVATSSSQNPTYRAYTSLTNALANGDTGTLFFRYFAEDAAGDFNHAFGLADETPTGFGSYEATQQVFGNTPDVRVRDGGGYSDVGDVTKGQWYNAWIVVNNATDTYDLYVNTGTADAVAGDKLTTSAVDFRNGTGSALNFAFFQLGGIINSTIDDGLAVYYDDIYFDNTGATFVNPIPEPSTYALIAGFLTLGLVLYRRRR